LDPRLRPKPGIGLLARRPVDHMQFILSRQTENVRRHRTPEPGQGLRPVQFWLPYTSTPEFAEARGNVVCHESKKRKSHQQKQRVGEIKTKSP
jgi:hypothetical protein